MDRANLDAVLAGDFESCPVCGYEPAGDADGPETINDGKVIVYDHSCPACGAQYAHVYGFCGVSILNDDGDSVDDWTEYPTPDDPRVQEPGAAREIEKDGRIDCRTVAAGIRRRHVKGLRPVIPFRG